MLDGMSARTVDLYAVLGVQADADDKTIRDAYRHLARRHHPDAGGDERVMLVLNKAWTVLGDPAKRNAYDQRLITPITGSKPSPAPSSAITRPPEPQLDVPAPIGRPSGTVIDFGRYIGWTVGQLAGYDPDYLLWLERTPLGRALRPEIQAALAGRASAIADATSRGR
jgi:curved DNA-binding protein CbpA